MQANSIPLVAAWNAAAEEIVTALLPRLGELAGCPGGAAAGLGDDDRRGRAGYGAHC